MARDGVAVDSALVGLVARIAGGEHVNVSAEAAALGTSRQQVYRYLKRFRAEGVDGFFPRSRAPQARPNQTPAHVEEAIVAARKRLAELGVDIGATSIQWWLEDNPAAVVDPDGVIAAVPSRATINRVLARRGQLRPVPDRRPRSAGQRRFTRPSANDLWQLDGYTTVLADGSTVWVIDIIDDHSRFVLASHAVRSESFDNVWAAFGAATDAAEGLPRQVLTDNGTALNGSNRGFTAGLEAALGALRVDPIATALGHPQTNGKVERVHATFQRWLAARPAAPTLAGLQRILDEGRDYYNQRRRHQALGGRTPARVWQAAHDAGNVCGPAGTRPARLHRTNPAVSPAGCISIDGLELSIGRAHLNANVTVFRTGDHITVFINGRYDHDRHLDRTKHYQPRHKPVLSPMS